MIKQCILLKSTWTFQERYETEETTARPVVAYRSVRQWGVSKAVQADILRAVQAILTSSGETVRLAGHVGIGCCQNTPSSYPCREISWFLKKKLIFRTKDWLLLHLMAL